MDGTLYKLMLVVHIIAVAIWLGSNLAMGLGSGSAAGASAEVNAWWAELQGFLGKTLKNVAFVLLLVTGIVMIVSSDKVFEFKNPFVSIGFLAVIIGGALGGMVFAPGCRSIAQDSRTGDTAAAKKTIDKLGMFGMAESLLVVVTIFFMVFKWGN